MLEAWELLQSCSQRAAKAAVYLTTGRDSFRAAWSGSPSYALRRKDWTQLDTDFFHILHETTEANLCKLKQAQQLPTAPIDLKLCSQGTWVLQDLLQRSLLAVERLPLLAPLTWTMPRISATDLNMQCRKRLSFPLHICLYSCEHAHGIFLCKYNVKLGNTLCNIALSPETGINSGSAWEFDCRTVIFAHFLSPAHHHEVRVPSPCRNSQELSERFFQWAWHWHSIWIQLGQRHQ